MTRNPDNYEQGEPETTGWKRWLQTTMDKTGFTAKPDYEWLVRHLPFLLFIAFLAWIHIANNHRAVNYIRKISKLERDVKELRWEYMTSKSELMHKSKQSEVAKMVEEQGLKELNEPPFIITD